MKKDMQMVDVEWMDVTKQMNDDAFNPKENIDKRLIILETIGWVYQESDNTLLLVQEFNDDHTPRDWAAIPKALIRKKTVLTEKKQ